MATCVPVFSAPTSVSCSARSLLYGGGVVYDESDPNHCSTSIEGTPLSASASASWLSADVSALAGINLDHRLYANASVSFETILNTSGPIRNGVMRYVWNANGWSSGPQIPATISSDYFTFHCTFELGAPRFCTDPAGAVPYATMVIDRTGDVVVPLGIAFPVAVYANAFAGGGPEAPGSSQGSISLAVEFFEADGVTPVPLQTVPEPSTWIAGVGLAGLLAWRRSRIRI
jgi:hypothetical protein